MNVFTYGSLMFPEVWTRVVRGVYAQASAAAHGFRRYEITGETYPGMVGVGDIRSEHDRVEGIVYFDVSAEDVAALDRFEGEDYRRVGVALRLIDGSSVDAAAYLYLPHEKLGTEAWSPDDFRLQSFLENYCGPR